MNEPTKTPAPRSGRVAALVIVPGAAAIAVLLLVLRVHVQPMEIPPYAITPAQAAGGPAVEVRPGGKFSLTIEPRGALTGAVMARGFLTEGTQGKTIRDWDPQFFVDKDGTLHVEGPVDTLFAGVPPGDWEVNVVVGRPEMLPRTSNDALRWRDIDGGITGWTLLRERVHLDAPAGG